MAKNPYEKTIHTPAGPITNPKWIAWNKQNGGSSNTNPSGGGGGGGGSPTSTGATKPPGRTDPDTGKPLKPGDQTADAIAKAKIRIKASYKSLFLGKGPQMPNGLEAYMLKNQLTDAATIEDWLRRNAEKVFVKTETAKARATEANQALDDIFGEDSKFKANFLKAYVMGGKDMTWGKYLETKVVKSAAFQQKYKGWELYYSTVGGSFESAIDNYNKTVSSYLDTYRTLMGKPDADLPPALAAYAISHNMDANAFKAYATANDPAYMDTMLPQTKADQIDDFWHTVYGEDSSVPADLKAEYMKTGEEKSFGDFFNDKIRNRPDFAAKYPGFDAWAKSQYGDVPGEGLHVDPMEYFKSRQQLKQFYEVLSEKPGAVNEALIDKALANNWSDARFRLEFQHTDPNYSNTSTYKEKKSRIDGYYKSIFGTEAQTPSGLADEWAKSSSEDVTSMFDSIKNTAEFAAQYGNWAEFASAQDFAGNSEAILENPAMYKQYRDAFYDAFRRVGVEPPAGYENMFFKSGIEEGDLRQNLNTYLATGNSYDWQTGQTADIGTASGITGGTGGADLRGRMEAALAQHRTYAGSKFQQYQTEDKNNFVTKKI